MTSDSKSEETLAKNIETNKIDEPEIVLHPDEDAQELQDLAVSIREQGLLQPVVVRKKGDRYQLIIGYRRYRAAKLFGIERIPAIIRTLDEKNGLLASATENVQRVASDIVKEAEIFKKLHDEFQMTFSGIAEKFGRSEAYVKQRIDLLGLPAPVQEMVQSGQIQIGAASALTKLDNDQDKILVGSSFRDGDFTVDRARAVVQDFKMYKEQAPEAPSEEIQKKAEEEPTGKCFFCNRAVLLSKLAGLPICEDCKNKTIYLLEKEKREKIESS